MRLRTLWAAPVLGIALLSAPAAAQNAAPAPATPAFGIDPRNLDRSVRPQDDFYRFVNGSWLKQTPMPADRSRYGTFDLLADESELALRTLLESAAAARSLAPGSDQQKLGDLYASFMDTVRVEALGLEPMREPLQRIRALTDRQGLARLFAEMRAISVQTPVYFYSGQDEKHADRYIAYVSQSGLGLPDRDYYLSDGERFTQIRAAYLGYIERLLRLAGEPDPAAAAKSVYALESALAQKHWERAKTRDRELTYNLKTVAELDRLTPAFSWSTYVATTGAGKTPGVVVNEPDYLVALDQVIQTTPVATWKQYLAFKLLDAYAPDLSKPFVDARFDFRGRALSGLQENRPRWKRGVTAVELAIGEAAGRQYVAQNFAPEARARSQQLVNNLLAAFRQGIDQLEWMSPDTRAQAQAKLAKITVKIGYPDEWRDYAALRIQRDDLAGNMMRANRFEFERTMRRLGQPVDRGEWEMTPQTVNAYYDPTMNEIVFPAAILRPPFFDPGADDAVNYGAIGGIIGHEISHGFDDQGRRSNGEGNLQDWWTEADNAAFQARADRLVEQFDAFTPIPGLKVNGKLTLGENIGDLSGLAVAYRAYRISLGGKEPPVIDGFTGDQRFFMGWAQAWRSMTREDALRAQILSDSHSPDEYRVTAVLRNMPEFYAAWNVQPGDKMYLPPEQRVKLW
jgi:predicted metalloendopeptidase